MLFGGKILKWVITGQHQVLFNEANYYLHQYQFGIRTALGIEIAWLPWQMICFGKWPCTV